jgi:diguanylate cyclase (GGDEF)-like protein
MTTERLGRSGATAKAGVLSYMRRAKTQSPGAVLPVAGASGATVLGIPEAEFTPGVRDAIMKLKGEVRDLGHQLVQLRARLEDAERAADQDQLLPVLNRRAFVRELTRHIAFAVRYGTPASLVYFDLDGFKRVNDTYGHAGGDAVLAHFSETLIQHVRESDVVGRLGGDEFGIVLTHAGHDQANRKAQSLLETLGARPASFNGQTIPLGFSYGAFELRASENAESVMARADEAMYNRKRVKANSE